MSAGEPATDGATVREKSICATLFILSLLTTTLQQSLSDVSRAFPDLDLLASVTKALGSPHFVWLGLRYSGPLMAILLFHEAGHYLWARKHKVRTSLPFFIPLPLIGFGTMGAVIKMRERITKRTALLDIGVSGPLAGLVIGIPILLMGLHLSPITVPKAPYWQEGNSLLYWAAKWLVKGHIPAGMDVDLHPMAFAGWIGLLITSINLIPVGQLDGGHVAYALFGERYARFSR